MRIDRSDLADKPDDARMGLSAAPPDSALRIERAAAYRAAVDAAYRQDAIDRGYARAEKTGRETITPAMRRIVAEAPERYPAGQRTARMAGTGWPWQLNRKAPALSPNWPAARVP